MFEAPCPLSITRLSILRLKLNTCGSFTMRNVYLSITRLSILRLKPGANQTRWWGFWYALNNKTLNSEIETSLIYPFDLSIFDLSITRLSILRLKLPLRFASIASEPALNNKTLNSEIETNSSCPRHLRRLSLSITRLSILRLKLSS